MAREARFAVVSKLIQVAKPLSGSQGSRMSRQELHEVVTQANQGPLPAHLEHLHEELRKSIEMTESKLVDHRVMRVLIVRQETGRPGPGPKGGTSSVA